MLVTCALVAAASVQAAPTARFRATPVQGDVCVAPCAVHFDAIGDGASLSSDPQFPRAFHSLLFAWGFGDDASATWAVSGLSKNVGIGGIAGHLYERPGTYNVALRVRNALGNEDRLRKANSVVVADPNDVFAPASTWCFANSGTPGGAGFEACPVAAASQHVVIPAATASGFNDALAACDATAHKSRCLFRAGDYFGSVEPVPLSDAEGAGLLARFGEGANPVVYGAPGFVVLGAGWTVTHFDVFMGATGSLFRLPQEVSHVTVFDVQAHNLRGSCFETLTGPALVHNDLVGIFELDCRTVPVPDGTSVYLRSERTLVMGNVFDSGYQGEFTLRSVHLPRSVIEHNLLARPQDDASNPRNVMQIRAWAGNSSLPEVIPPVPSKTEYVIISDNVMSQDNAGMVIRTCQSNDCSDTSHAPGIENLIIERNFFSFSRGGTGGNSQMPRAFWVQGGDITIRDNVLDLQGIRTDLTHGLDRLVDHAPNLDSAPDLDDDDVHVLNNVVYFDDVSPNGFQICAGGAFGVGHECRNNLVYIPNESGPKLVDDGGAWRSSNNLFATRNPFAAPVPAQGMTSPDDFRIAPGSAAADAGFDPSGSDTEVWLDFGGRCRPARAVSSGAPRWDIGAFEVAGTNCLAVPEPATVLMVGLGLSAIAAHRPRGTS